MTPLRVVLDTNVIVAAMRSRRGASYRILSLLGDPRFEFAISAALIFEYEAVAFRPTAGVPILPDAIHKILDRICLLGYRPTTFLQWRPQLYLDVRGRRSSWESFDWALAQVPDVPPDPGDEL